MEQVFTQGRERGASLVEFMVATLVGMALIGALFSVVYNQSQERRASTERSLALSTALTNLERARTLDEAALLALDGVGFDVVGPDRDSRSLPAVGGDPDGLPGEFSVELESRSGRSRLYRVVTSVHWRGTSGEETVALEALIGERR